MSWGDIIGLVVAVLAAYSFLKPAKKDDKIEALKVDKAKEEGRLEVLKELQKDIPAQVQAEHKDASEEKKAQFWEEQLGKKRD